MPQAHDKGDWYLARANEPPCVLSTRELLILAELGHLRADDLVWRSGTNAKRSIRSMLGVQKLSPSRTKLAGMRLPPAATPTPQHAEATVELPAAPTPGAPQQHGEATVEPPAAPAPQPDERGQGRKWALAGALSGAAIVLLMAAAGAAIFFQSLQPDPPKPIEARLTPQTTTEPSAAGEPADEAATAEAATDEAAPDEVAVRKVKVLKIPAPPGQ